jgi:hypothetical protein
MTFVDRILPDGFTRVKLVRTGPGRYRIVTAIAGCAIPRALGLATHRTHDLDLAQALLAARPIELWLEQNEPERSRRRKTAQTGH